jgi:hypothetical protein
MPQTVTIWGVAEPPPQPPGPSGEAHGVVRNVNPVSSLPYAGFAAPARRLCFAWRVKCLMASDQLNETEFLPSDRLSERHTPR